MHEAKADIFIRNYSRNVQVLNDRQLIGFHDGALFDLYLTHYLEAELLIQYISHVSQNPLTKANCEHIKYIFLIISKPYH